MGSSKGTNTVEKQAEPSAEEKALLQLQLKEETALSPQKMQISQQGYSLISQLLAGDANLPGFLGDISSGLDENAINDLSQKAIKDVAPQFQGQGILDSGTAASLMARTSGDIRRSAYEYNIQNKMNLLNLALAGNINTINSGTSNDLTSRLAGLRAITTSSGYNNTNRAIGGAAGGAMSGAQAGSSMSGGNPYATVGGAIVGGIGGWYANR